MWSELLPSTVQADELNGKNLTLKSCSLLQGHRARVGTMSWSSHILSSGSRDRSILQRDVRAREDYVHKFTGHRSEVGWCVRTCGMHSPQGAVAVCMSVCLRHGHVSRSAPHMLFLPVKLYRSWTSDAWLLMETRRCARQQAGGIMCTGTALCIAGM